MKKLSFILIILLSMTMCNKVPKGQRILIETSHGNIKIVLYDDTPLHRDNFIKLTQEGYYEDLTFHRVIKGFMIQGGDIKSASDSTNRKFDRENTVEAEFRIPKYFHKPGAIGASRWGEEENPKKVSDAFQFYIVSGKKVYDFDINTLEKNRFERLKQKILQDHQSSSIDMIKAFYKEGNRAGIAEVRASNLAKAEKEAEERRNEILFTPELKETYLKLGGAPHLDGEYTVFGEVYEGLNIVKEIEQVDVNSNDKPLKAVIIKKISLID